MNKEIEITPKEIAKAIEDLLNDYEDLQEMIKWYSKTYRELQSRVYKAVKLLEYYENDTEANRYAPIRETLEILITGDNNE